MTDNDKNPPEGKPFIHLTPEQKIKIRALAALNGMTIKEYLFQVVANALLPKGDPRRGPVRNATEEELRPYIEEFSVGPDPEFVKEFEEMLKDIPLGPD